MVDDTAQSSIGKYLGPLVYGANDGIITTFAVISGAAGAALGPDVMVIMGAASLFADGFSMGVSSYLSVKSQQEYDNERKNNATAKSPYRNGIATFFAFVFAGSLPLFPFLLLDPVGGMQFIVSAIATGMAFFIVGSLRSYLLDKSWWWAGLEMLLIGGGAAVIAFSLGAVVKSMLL